LSRPRIAAILALLGCLSAGLAAREVDLSLITILPGDSLYSAFGHSALRVVDHNTGEDVLFNYGLSAKPFDLAFVASMLSGRMDFMVAAMDTRAAFNFYKEVENRTIIEDRLALSEAEKLSVMAILRRDVRPENSTYNYRYFTDNCATRIGDIIQGLAPAGKEAKPAPTIRQALGRVLGGDSWLGLALGIILGPRTDRPRDTSDALFLPQDVMEWAAGHGLAGARTLVYEARPRKADLVSPIAACLAALALAAGLALVPRRRRAPGLVLDAALFLLAAVAGLAILVFWLCAGYGEAAWNLNLLWAGPLPLLALFLGAGKKTKALSRGLFAASALGGLLVALLGGLGIQAVSWDLRALALALALRCALRAAPFHAKDRTI
jgi:hypothetical protein